MPVYRPRPTERGPGPSVALILAALALLTLAILGVVLYFGHS